MIPRVSPWAVLCDPFRVPQGALHLPRPAGGRAHEIYQETRAADRWASNIRKALRFRQWESHGASIG